MKNISKEIEKYIIEVTLSKQHNVIEHAVKINWCPAIWFLKARR